MLRQERVCGVADARQVVVQERGLPDVLDLHVPEQVPVEVGGQLDHQQPFALSQGGPCLFLEMRFGRGYPLEYLEMHRGFGYGCEPSACV